MKNDVSEGLRPCNPKSAPVFLNKKKANILLATKTKAETNNAAINRRTMMRRGFIGYLFSPHGRMAVFQFFAARVSSLAFRGRKRVSEIRMGHIKVQMESTMLIPTASIPNAIDLKIFKRESKNTSPP